MRADRANEDIYNAWWGQIKKDEDAKRRDKVEKGELSEKMLKDDSLTFEERYGPGYSYNPMLLKYCYDNETYQNWLWEKELYLKDKYKNAEKDQEEGAAGEEQKEGEAKKEGGEAAEEKKEGDSGATADEKKDDAAAEDKKKSKHGEGKTLDEIFPAEGQADAEAGGADAIAAAKKKTRKSKWAPLAADEDSDKEKEVEDDAIDKYEEQFDPWEDWEESDKTLWMQIAEFSSIAKVYHNNPEEFDSAFA